MDIPNISLIKPNGLVMSNDSLPVGSFRGGNTFGGSLPNPLGFFSTSINGINSNETNAYP